MRKSLPSPDHFGSVAVQISRIRRGSFSRPSKSSQGSPQTRASRSYSIRALFPVLGTLLAVAGAWCGMSVNGAGVPVYRLASVETRLTTNPLSQIDPSISGRYVAWTDFRDGEPGAGTTDANVFLFDLATGVERQITSVPAFQGFTALSGSRLIYTDSSRGDREQDIMVFDIATGRTLRLDSPDVQWGGDIDGDLIVYDDWRNWNSGGQDDIYLFDLSTRTETRLTDDPARQVNPAISGSRVVWTDFRHGASEVYLLDLRTGQLINVSQNPTRDGAADIEGDIVTYVSDRDGGVRNVFYHRLGTSQTVQITHASGYGAGFPRVSGDYISYEMVNPETGVANVYVHSISRGTGAAVSPSTAYQSWNAHCGNRVVYTDMRNGNQDIYLATFKFVPVPRLALRLVRTEVAALAANVPDRPNASRMDLVVRALDEALHDHHWLDDARLSPQGGEAVFHSAATAAEILGRWRHEDPSGLDAEAWQRHVELLVEAMQQLAATGIADAKARGGDTAGIAQAEAELVRGDGCLALGNVRQGLLRYCQSWRFALGA